MVVEVALGKRVDADVDVGFGGSEEEMSEERFEDEGVVKGADDEIVSLVVLGGPEEVLDVFGCGGDGKRESFSFGLDLVAEFSAPFCFGGWGYSLFGFG